MKYVPSNDVYLQAMADITIKTKVREVKFVVHILVFSFSSFMNHVLLTSIFGHLRPCAKCANICTAQRFLCLQYQLDGKTHLILQHMLRFYHYVMI